MSLLINKPLTICLKVSGLWPYEFNYIGPLAILSTLVTTLPFQCWKAANLINDPILLMDSLSDILAEILIMFKLFTMWINKRRKTGFSSQHGKSKIHLSIFHFCISKFYINLYNICGFCYSLQVLVSSTLNSSFALGNVSLMVPSRYMTDLLRNIIDDWNREIIPDQWKILARYCSLFCTFDIALYLSAVLFYYPDLISTYINKPPEARQLLFQSHYPFDYHNSPNYECLNAMQIIQGFLIIAVDTLSKSLLLAYILHVTARVHLLKGYIEEYSDSCIETTDKSEKIKYTNLRRVIREHLHILLLVDKIDAAYNYISLLQIVFSNIIICVTGFVVITAMENANIILLLKFVMYIMAMLSQAFVFCIAGQYLRDKGESITEMIYSTLWYNAEPKEIKAIMFIIANTQNPLTLSGGKLFELSIDTFAQILKTSFSYLSVLRAVYA